MNAQGMYVTEKRLYDDSTCTIIVQHMETYCGKCELYVGNNCKKQNRIVALLE